MGEESCDGGVAPGPGVVEGGDAVVVGDARVGSRGQQQAQDLLVIGAAVAEEDEAQSWTSSSSSVSPTEGDSGSRPGSRSTHSRKARSHEGLQLFALLCRQI